MKSTELESVCFHGKIRGKDVAVEWRATADGCFWGVDYWVDASLESDEQYHARIECARTMKPCWTCSVQLSERKEIAKLIPLLKKKSSPIPKPRIAPFLR